MLGAASQSLQLEVDFKLISILSVASIEFGRFLWYEIWSKLGVCIPSYALFQGGGLQYSIPGETMRAPPSVQTQPAVR